MQPISKEEFIKILERQRKSGLSIKDFCENESYTQSSFYYWKSKYGLDRSYNNHAGDSTVMELTPIKINPPAKRASPSSHAVKNVHGGEITVILPGGVRVSFKGGAQCEMAMGLLDQIFSSHVLP
ncbi:MAG: IS66 family insertion sequence element accessory protein TnpB [Bacteroidales bacterium]|nr:IS66 family insertion sequence element accessory protein TnpB [Bacteroidales bacterium]